MKKIFKVNLEEFKNENMLKVILDFIKSYKNKIKIIHNNKIKQLENELITKISKLKFILLDNPFYYQSYKMIYKIRDFFDDLIKNIKIFGEDFVENNYSKCFIIYKGIIFPLKEYFSSKYIDIEKDKKLEIKLLLLKKISDFSSMFKRCKSLEEFAFYENDENNIMKENDNKYIITYERKKSKNLETSNYENIIINEQNNSVITVNDNDEKFYKFYGHNEYNEYINNTSSIQKGYKNNSFSFEQSYSVNWNINDTNKLVNFKKLNTIINITTMYSMFYECSSLISLPDISKWNTNNVTNMGHMFSNCSKLSSLPDISKWDTKNVTYMSSMFDGCPKLKNKPKFKNK